MKYVKIDGNEIKNREELHEEIKSQLDFPDYYGKNLDALYDMLGSFTEPVEFEIVNQEMLEKHLGHYAKMFLGLLEDIKGESDV